MKSEFKVMGINDDESTCSCCGKTGLKRVVWLAPISPDGDVIGEAFPCGTTCAAFKLRITTEKATRITAKIEAAIERKLIESVDAKIAAIRRGMVIMNNCFVPANLTNLPLSQALAARDAQFPILGYYNGKITLKQAAEYL